MKAGLLASRRCLLIALFAALFLAPAVGQARTLLSIQQRGALSLCAHPNALPYAKRSGPVPGFQIELGRALAVALGVSLRMDWIVTGYQVYRADCDILLDKIHDREAQSNRGIRLSKPYHSGGVAIATRPDDTATNSYDDLVGRRVGVQYGSMAQMLLGKAGVRAIPFGFEDEMVEALAAGEIDAAAVTPTAAEYFNHRNPDRRLRIVDAYEGHPDLSWTIAVGFRRSDRFLRRAVDKAMAELVADGTIAAIYAKYGLTHRPPKPGR